MKISNLAKSGLAIAAFAAVGAMSSGAHAADARIDCCFVTGINEIEDTNVDRILRDGVVIESGTFQAGDVVQSLLRFNTVNNQNINVAVGDLTYQLTAYATLTIVSVTDTLGGSCDIGDACVAVTNPIVNVYEIDNSTDYLAQAPATGITNVQTDGTLVLTLGLVQPDDFWVIQFTRTADTFADIANAASGSPQAGLYVFGISATSNPGNIPFTPDSMPDGVTGALHDFVGNGSGYALSPGANPDWLLSTNTTVLFNIQAVPEPGSMALLGLGLAAAGFVVRRRKA